MRQCAKCKGENFKVLTHYEYYDIYECINCGYWTYPKSEDCCRKPNFIVVVEHIDWNKPRVFYQCTNCGHANRAKCIDSKKYDDLIDSDFDKHKFDDREVKKFEELAFIKQQFEYYKNSVSFKYHEYLNTGQWKEKRKLVLQRDNFTCQHCKIEPAYDIHHISYRTIYKEELNELMSVCRNCHREIHKSFFFEDEKGR